MLCLSDLTNRSERPVYDDMNQSESMTKLMTTWTLPLIKNYHFITVMNWMIHVMAVIVNETVFVITLVISAVIND